MTVDLRAVAQASGVSVSTASRALADSPRVNVDTARRVREAAQALSYRPNATARALRTAKTSMVGLVVTNLMNASFRVIAQVMQQALSVEGFHLVLAVTSGDAEQERAAVHTLLDHNATGVIVAGLDPQGADELGRSGLPVVHLARRPERPVGDCVLGDDLAGARAATAHLLDLGHRRIAVIAGPQTVTSGRERVDGYRQEMAARNVAVAEDLLLTGPFAPDTGSDAVQRLWRRSRSYRPTALLVTNHEACLGALPAVAELGVAVPEELSIVSFEDTDLTRCWHPAITVVDNNAATMGLRAAALLLERIRGRSDPFTEVRIGTTLMVRHSTAAPARA